MTSGFLEFARLDEGIGAGGGIDHQQGFVRCRGIFASEDAFDFAKFLHQIMFVMKAAGGVADQVLDAAAFRGFPGIVTNGGRVRFVLGFDDRNGEALGPLIQLLDGGGTEGIGCGKHHFFSLTLEEMRQLGGAGGFAHAIDADDQNNAGGVSEFRQACGRGREDFEDFFAAHVDDFFSLEAAAFGSQDVQDVHRHAHPNIASDEAFLEFIEVYLPACKALQQLFEKSGHNREDISQPNRPGFF